LADETITDIERFQEFGFESYPVTGTAEALIAFLNGNRELGITICVHDRGKRPTDLLEGDSCMYDKDGNRVWLNAGILKMMEATESFLKGDTFDTWLTGTLKAIFDAHVHPSPAGGSTGITATPLTAPSGHLSTVIKGS
jgi:phage gp45-like